MEKEGKYIYCIIEREKPITDNRIPITEFGPIGIGERGDKVYTICFNSIGAVVSDSPIVKYSASRENFLSHERVIEEVMNTYTVLPVRFCTIAEDEEKVKKMLEKGQNMFVDLLRKIEGKKELGLKAIFKEDVIYQNILEKYKDIKKLKDEASNPQINLGDGKPAQSTYLPPVPPAQRMKIGEMVKSALQRESENYKQYILDTLSPIAIEVKVNNTYWDMMIINAAFLVEKHRETEFDRKVNELDAKYCTQINFKYVGTLPPFNFVNLALKMGEY